jgi:N-acetyl-anhydromuramyl-L-alanine amidase AmpD
MIKQNHLPSNYYNTHFSPREIKYLILHHIACGCLEEAIAMFMQHQVSAHFLIDFTGNITQLVAENNVAYHAGISHWQKQDGLNINSIGIEFINPQPEILPFSLQQMQAGVALLQYLIKKYNISSRNVLGHSDIAYFNNSQLINRKQDPSILFDWQFLAKNGIGFFPQKTHHHDFIKYSFADCNQEIAQIKQQLYDFGYKILEFSGQFNFHMQQLTIVFNRHFNNIAGIENNNYQYWLNSSSSALKQVLMAS